MSKTVENPDVATVENPDVAAVKELLGRATLRSIEYHELAARWTGEKAEGEQPEANVNLGLQRRIDEESFGFRLTAEVSMGFGEARAAVAANYDFDGDPPELRTLLAFGNEVGVMALFPYLRESISSITARVFGDPLLLPTLARGEVGFDLDSMK